MIGIDLFAGAGGMALGAKWAGIDVKFAIEIDKFAAKTYQHNHPDTKVLVTDIRKFKSPPFINRNDEIIIFGGPPCQGFSTSNQKTRNANNPSNWLFEDFLRIIKLLRPEWVLFENVKGIIETCDGYFLDKIRSSLMKLDYTISQWVLDAADFGVPQRRNRLFLIGSINGETIPVPLKLTIKPPAVRDALYDLPNVENGARVDTLPYRFRARSDYAKQMREDLKTSSNHLVTNNSPEIIQRYKYIPQGGNWSCIPKELLSTYKDISRCHTGIYYRLKENSPSVVIANFRKNMLIHPIQDRGLSVREAARLQSFPDNYRFIGSIGFQQQQVGNAVPPLLAKTVFNSILGKR